MLGVFGGYLLTFGQKIIKKSGTIWADIGTIISIVLLSVFLWDIRATTDWSYSWPHGPYHFPLVPVLIMILVVLLPFTRYI